MTIQNVRLATAAKDPAVNLAVKSLEAQLNTIIAQINAALATAASDTVAGLLEIAVQSELEAASSTTLAVTPGRMHFHPGVAKFWAVVTVSGGAHSLVVSYNVTSITDGATGIHTVTIATDFSSADWACVTSAEGSGTSSDNARMATASSKAVGSVVVSTYNLSATPALADATSITTVGYGDHA